MTSDRAQPPNDPFDELAALDEIEYEKIRTTAATSLEIRVSVLDRIASELELSPLARYPLVPRKTTSVWRGRLNRLISVRPESTAILGRPRGFSLDKWREVLTRADGQLIQREAGDLLIELGYETSADWISDLRRPERLVFLPAPRARSKRRQPTLAAPPQLAATEAA